jgi:hypothetical protein
MMNPKSCFAQSAISCCNRQQQIQQDERERESKCKLQSSRVYEKIAKEEHIP